MYIFISVCVTQVRAQPWHRIAKTARRVNDVYGGSIAKENTVRFWFLRFRSANIDLNRKDRKKPSEELETQVVNEKLKAIMEADPPQTTSDLAAGYGVSDK